MVLKLSTHTEKRWNIYSKEKLSKPNISPRIWAILGQKRGKIANFGKKKLILSSLIMLMKMCMESGVQKSISEKNFVIFFY